MPERSAGEERRKKRVTRMTLEVSLGGKNVPWTRRAGEGRMEVPPRQREGVSNLQACAADSANLLLEEPFIAVQGGKRSSPRVHGDPLHDWI